jgi:hypothetical protein
VSFAASGDVIDISDVTTAFAVRADATKPLA